MAGLASLWMLGPMTELPGTAWCVGSGGPSVEGGSRLVIGAWRRGVTRVPVVEMFPSETLRAYGEHMKLLVSACLAGAKCGVDGTSYGQYPKVLELLRLPGVVAVSFCPEHFSFGTPRAMPDIHGGNGHDVLDGTARVLTDKGEDWTEGFIDAAYEMLRLAQDEEIDVAILQNMSAACGSQVISDGCRLVPVRKFQRGLGVCTALLQRHGFRTINALDYRKLEHLHQELDPSHEIDASARDYDESEWYVTHFGER